MIIDQLRERFGQDKCTGTMVGHESYIVKLLRIIQPKHFVEIGTYRGMSTALWALHCRHATTIDINELPICKEIWDFLEVSDKITHKIVASSDETDEFLANIDFDMAFIDGEHNAKAVECDFGATQKCGCVLFHDYKPDTGIYADCENQRFPDVAAIIDSLEPKPIPFGVKCNQFALWIAEGHALWQSQELLDFLEERKMMTWDDFYKE